VNGGSPDWVIDYESIIDAHLERQPSRVWPGLRFAIPMSQEEWRGFPRFPGWKYEWDVRLGADAQIRPFGPHYRIRDESYSKALAEIVNYQHRVLFSTLWGEGTTSSSDGQRYRAGGRGEAAGQVNLKYGNDPGVTFYTHISDQYAPFHTEVINAAVRDATHVLDGLLYHESDLRIEEHYTDTAGFTDHVFALCHLLGFRFAPRIRDLADKRLYVSGKASQWSSLSPLIGGSIMQGSSSDSSAKSCD
jgi:TnpA family transposase